MVPDILRSSKDWLSLYNPFSIFVVMTVISSFLTFPNISWWMQAVQADKVILDTAEHFDKMSYRNRYRISGANNSILLTVPLVNGRNQHTPMAEVLIHNAERWQLQHWRTLVSVYKRSPYFEHYEPELKHLYGQEFTHLLDFNRAGMQWVLRQLKPGFSIEETSVYLKDHGNHVTDLRIVKTPSPIFKKYYQVFEDRTGFVPDLSILDLLFSEGPRAVELLGG
jgi:hypothetical protein